MANLSSNGGSPITFVDAGGAQYSLPLTFVSFTTAGGVPSVAGWPGWAGKAGPELAGITGWVAYLGGLGFLLPNITPPPASAFTISARDAGAAGDDIKITFGTVTPNSATPSATTVDVTVATSQIYNGLTIATIGKILGTAPLGGSAPGLAYVTTPPTTLPTAAAAANFTGTPLQYELPGSGGILEPTHDAATEAADAALLQAAVSNVDSGAGTFTLTLSWSKTHSALPLNSLAATFAYLVTITPPTGGFVSAPAANSSVSLSGGIDPTLIPPSPAGITIAPG
jgi:hypothetical protein